MSGRRIGRADRPAGAPPRARALETPGGTALVAAGSDRRTSTPPRLVQGVPSAQDLRIRAPAGGQRPVGFKISMSDGEVVSGPIDICDELA